MIIAGLTATVTNACVTPGAKILDKIYSSITKSKHMPKERFYRLLRQSPHSFAAFDALSK